MIANRRGMTLVELLIAMVAGMVVLGAAYQVLVTSQRVYTVQSERVVGQQTVRAGMEVLFGELREVSPREGDLLDLDEREVEVRAMRAFGLVCDIGTGSISVLLQNGEIEADHRMFVFADGDPEDMSDDDWVEFAGLSVTDDSSACAQGSEVQTVTGLSGIGDVREGAPVRSAATWTYGAYEFDDGWYLGRTSGGSSSAVPLVGPLDSRTGLRFEYLDADAMETTDPSEVRRIRVTLRTASDATDRSGNEVSDSLTADVFLRN